MEAAATGATTKATDELRRVTDAILRIGVEAAEDERAIHELGESGLLPPTQDVESLLDWLRRRKVACWSGWKYIEENVRAAGPAGTRPTAAARGGGSPRRRSGLPPPGRPV